LRKRERERELDLVAGVTMVEGKGMKGEVREKREEKEEGVRF
jgi:hypothetical protein